MIHHDFCIHLEQKLFPANISDHTYGRKILEPPPFSHFPEDFGVFRPRIGRLRAVRHTIEPRASYSYSIASGQSKGRQSVSLSLVLGEEPGAVHLAVAPDDVLAITGDEILFTVPDSGLRPPTGP